MLYSRAGSLVGFAFVFLNLLALYARKGQQGVKYAFYIRRHLLHTTGNSRSFLLGRGSRFEEVFYLGTMEATDWASHLIKPAQNVFWC
jgi:hypothetical protein